MGLDQDFCNIPELEEKDIKSGPLNLDQNDVVIITGGAKGVTSECAFLLAKESCASIILIGRSSLTENESSWLKGIETEADLKKAILVNEFGSKKG